MKKIEKDDAVKNNTEADVRELIIKGDLFAEKCPSRIIFKHATSQWGGLVLLVLKGGTFRFSELKKIVQGVSEKMLAQTLQALESDGFILRVAYPVVPPHVEYSLTELGKGVTYHIEGLANWIETNSIQIFENQANYQAEKDKKVG